MKAIRLHGAKDLRLDEVEAPANPSPGEVRIKVDAVGICGSDLHMYGTGAIGGIVTERPFILGHEFMGTITDTDAASKLLVGQRVAVDPAVPCGICECCLEGHPNLCPYHRFMGVFPTDGALCEEMRVPTSNCFREK